MSQVSIIDIEGNHPQIPTQFNANVGFAIPLANELEILGTSVAATLIPLQTVGSGNTISIQAQRSSAQAVATVAANGIAHFNSAQFSVDSNGFVSLSGGGLAIDSIAVQTGTSPIVPTAAGLVTINGAVVAAGTNPVRTDGTGTNTMAVEVQISQALAASDATKIGLCNFDSSSFAVDSNGFVTFTGSSGTTCLFSAYTSTSYNNVTGDGTVYTVIFDTADVNIGSAYNAATGVFTAPASGNYLFTATLMLNGFLTSHTDCLCTIQGAFPENRFFWGNGGVMAANGDVLNVSGSLLLKMTAGEIQYVNVQVSNGTKVINVKDFYCIFSGYRIP